MKFAVEMFPTDYSIGPADLGRAAEDLGFESLWFPEHTHIPASRRTPFPGGRELPQEYSHTLDPFVALTAVAAVTSTLKLGTGICLVIERDPIVLAKEVASLDHFSGGRVLFGIGGGWNEEEMENHGTDPRRRWKVLRERVQAMQQIWTQDEAEYHGEFVNFDPIWSWPKPLQKPYPPVLIGGSGANTFRRVVEYGDGWMPIAGRNERDMGEQLAELRRMAADAGREQPTVSIFGAPARPEVIERYAEAGVDRLIFGLPAAPPDVVLPILERHAGVMREAVRA